jgi:hypothetical protein
VSGLLHPTSLQWIGLPVTPSTCREFIRPCVGYCGSLTIFLGAPPERPNKNASLDAPARPGTRNSELKVVETLGAGWRGRMERRGCSWRAGRRYERLR